MKKSLQQNQHSPIEPQLSSLILALQSEGIDQRTDAKSSRDAYGLTEPLNCGFVLCGLGYEAMAMSA